MNIREYPRYGWQLPGVKPDLGSVDREARTSASTSYFRNDLRRRPARHPRQAFYTDSRVLDLIEADIGPFFDPCPGSQDVDGLSSDWPLTPVFCNPPYGEARRGWVDRCIEHSHGGTPVVLLVPASTDTASTQRILETAAVVVFPRGRLKFAEFRPNGRRMAASHPSLIAGWNTLLPHTSMLGAAR